MKIGFDLDGVLADLYDLWLAVIAYEYGIKNIIGQSECNQYSIKKVINERCGVNLSRNNMDSALDFIIPQINIVKPFKGAKKILKTVSMSAKNPVIITARLDKYKDCTRAWVDQWLGDYQWRRRV
jgi:5'(3')-deoxyribonucleotidase